MMMMMMLMMMMMMLSLVYSLPFQITFGAEPLASIIYDDDDDDDVKLSL